MEKPFIGVSTSENVEISAEDLIADSSSITFECLFNKFGFFGLSIPI